MFHLIGQLIVGLIVGVIARLILPGREPIAAGALGWLITALLGVAGAFIGSLIGSAIRGGEDYVAGWIISIIGAILLLLLARLILGDRSST